MKLFAPQKWDYTDRNLDGILFFTQRIDEMLFDFTISKYKSPVLNPHLLIKEYLEVYHGENITHSNLPYILEELKCSMLKDPVLKSRLGADYIESTCQALCTLPNDKKVILLELINSTWGDTQYCKWCIQYAKDVLKNSNSKEKIDMMLRSLIPELIGFGYSPSFIYGYNREFFSLKSNSGYDKACEFLDRFNGKEQKYTVYLACSKTIEVFRPTLTSRLDINFEEDENCALYKHDADQVIVYIKDIEALDDNSAAQSAYNTLNFFLRFYSAISNRKPLGFSTKAMVFLEDRQKPKFVTFRPNGFSAIQDIEERDVPTVTTAIINGVVENGQDSYYQLRRVLDLHNTSLASTDYNGAYLNLWSILEILTLSQNEKVSSVLEVLIPLLQKDYFYTCFKDFNNKLETALGNPEYASLLAKITEQEEEIDKIACFLLSPKFKELRVEISDRLTRYPVLRYRMHYFSEISFDINRLKNVLLSYTERTTWHIRRIYRLRNYITHSGIVPDNIKSVGDHLHSYVDSIIEEVVFNLASDKSFNTIENVLLDVILSANSMLTSLSKKILDEKEIISIILHSSYTI